MGKLEDSTDGWIEGRFEGCKEGNIESWLGNVGWLEGLLLDFIEGAMEGRLEVGVKEGDIEGKFDGINDGLILGDKEGSIDGIEVDSVGKILGLNEDGRPEGPVLGKAVGS